MHEKPKVLRRLPWWHEGDLGVAVCPTRRLLVHTTTSNELHLRRLLPIPLAPGKLRGQPPVEFTELLYTVRLGFQFRCPADGTSGAVCFAVHDKGTLLVTDAGHDAVHIVEVATGAHAGYLQPPGSSLPGPTSSPCCL